VLEKKEAALSKQIAESRAMAIECHKAKRVEEAIGHMKRMKEMEQMEQELQREKEAARIARFHGVDYQECGSGSSDDEGAEGEGAEGKAKGKGAEDVMIALNQPLVRSGSDPYIGDERSVGALVVAASCALVEPVNWSPLSDDERTPNGVGGSASTPVSNAGGGGPMSAPVSSVLQDFGMLPKHRLEELKAAAVDLQRKHQAEAKAKQEAEAKAQAKAKQEAEAKAKQEAEAKAQQEAEAKAQAKAKQEAEAKAKQEAEAKAQAKAKQEAEAKAQAKAKQEAEGEAEEELETDASWW
jgi:hypothetical protein